MSAWFRKCVDRGGTRCLDSAPCADAASRPGADKVSNWADLSRRRRMPREQSARAPRTIVESEPKHLLTQRCPSSQQSVRSDAHARRSRPPRNLHQTRTRRRSADPVLARPTYAAPAATASQSRTRPTRVCETRRGVREPCLRLRSSSNDPQAIRRTPRGRPLSGAACEAVGVRVRRVKGEGGGGGWR